MERGRCASGKQRTDRPPYTRRGDHRGPRPCAASAEGGQPRLSPCPQPSPAHSVAGVGWAFKRSESSPVPAAHPWERERQGWQFVEAQRSGSMRFVGTIGKYLPLLLLAAIPFVGQIILTIL